MVEHVARGKEENGDDAESSPQIPRLDDGENIGPGD